MTKPILAIRIAQLRKERAMTQQQLADALLLTRGRINNYEQGTREPDYEILCKLAIFFNVTSDYLLGISNYQTPTAQTVAPLTADSVDDLPEEARRSIEEFKEHLRTKYGKQPPE
jgi:transcriptional regulator with XRE-family HTH domain